MLLPALALGGAGVARAVSVASHGDVRQRYVVLSPFHIDGLGTPHHSRTRNELRLDVGGRFEVSRQLWMQTTLQVFDGQVLGDEGDLSAGPDSRLWRNGSIRDDLFLREAVIQVPIGLGEVRVGRRGGEWGSGLVVHDGRAPTSPFGDAHGGDIYNGILVDAMPLRAFVKGRAAEAVRLHLGFDVIERDELVDRKRGDLALRYSAAILWDEPKTRAGLMMVHRNIDMDKAGERSDTLFDVMIHIARPIGDALEVILSAESAALVGRTDERTGRADDAMATTKLRQLGVLARAELSAPAAGLRAGLELGAATGDSDPLDGTDTTFRFDPAFRVGMVLFEDVLSRATAATRRDLLAAGTETPRSRIDAYATGGSVSSTIYAAPLVAFQTADGSFLGHLGGLIAFAPVGLSAPDLDDKNSNPYGAGSGLLGWEVNAAAAVRVALPETAEFSIGAQYGVFKSGPALRSVDGAAQPQLVHKWRVLADVRW